jgi:hypothetical protein
MAEDARAPSYFTLLASVVQKLEAALALIDQVMAALEPRCEEVERFVEARQQIMIAITLARKEADSS